MLTMNYRTSEPVAAPPGAARISRYAGGAADFHDVIHERLRQLIAFVNQREPSARARGVVDSAPLAERDFAQLAGLGWIGKNTLLLTRTAGSWFFLAALLTDLELEYDAPHTTDHCGSCRACLDACPTAAFPRPYELDATRCISYLTIEHRGHLPQALRTSIGDWLFGCDICQDVCPWNSRAPFSNEPGFAPQQAHNPVDAAELFDLSDDELRRRFRRTPLWRAKRQGLLRNAGIVLGNRPTAAGDAALARGLRDRDAVVRATCAWALGRSNSQAARQALAARLECEADPLVRAEIQGALAPAEDDASRFGNSQPAQRDDANCDDS
jgi:epoxyqueuosine reductase